MRQYRVTSDNIPGAKAKPQADCFLDPSDPMYDLSYKDGRPLNLNAFNGNDEDDCPEQLSEKTILKG